MLHSFAEDYTCCGPLIQNCGDALDPSKSWTCPVCGCEWRARDVAGAMWFWEPFEVIQVFALSTPRP